MKIEKHGNRYRVRTKQLGKWVVVSFDHRPTQKEIMTALTEKMSIAEATSEKGCFGDGAIAFLEAHTEIFSPSTINGYKSSLKSVSDNFKALKISKISQVDVQSEINSYAADHAPKTTRNFYGFIRSVLKYYRPTITLNVNMPQKDRVDSYTPTDTEVKSILNEIKGTKYEIAFRLAVYGLRRSEILAITADDLNGNLLTINKAKVYNGSGYTIKTTKTTMSTREIYIDDELSHLIKDSGVAYEGNPHLILQNLHRIQNKLRIPEFRFHCFRYYYVSMAHAMGIPDIYIQAAGGWSTPSTMNRVYKHTMRDKEQEMMRKASGHIQSLI